MAATFAWTQSNTSAGTKSDLGVSGNLFNYKKNDSATAADYSSNPIPAGERSMEVWLQGKFTGSFNTVENVQFWRSTDFSPNTGLSLKWGDGGVSAFATPTSAESKATTNIPTSDPGSANVSIGGNITGSLSASGYTDYIVTQLNTTSAANAGDTSLCTMTLNYDEN